MDLNKLKEYAKNQVLPLLAKDMNRVSALAFQGGIGRGSFDHLSDIDLLIGFDNIADSNGIIKGEHKIDGKKWSIFHLSFDKVSPKRWSDKLRYVYGYETEIFYDKNLKLSKICRDSLLSDEEKKDRIVYKIKKLGNRGITYHGIVNEDWRGIYWGDPYDLWIVRGNNYAAHMRLNQAVEIVIDLIYSINSMPVPSPKWKHHLVTGLDWTPNDFVRDLHDASIINELSESDVERRTRSLVAILTHCVDKSLSLHLLPEDMGRYYFPKFSTHSDNTDD